MVNRQLFFVLFVITGLLSFSACGKGEDISLEKQQLYHVDAEYQLGREDKFLIPVLDTADAEFHDRSNFFFYKSGISCLVTMLENEEKKVYLCSCDLNGGNPSFQRLSFNPDYEISTAKVLPDGELYVLYSNTAVDQYDGQHLGKIVDSSITELFNLKEIVGSQNFYGNGTDRFWFSEITSDTVKECDAEGHILGVTTKPYQIITIFCNPTNGNPIFVENNDGTIIIDSGGTFTEAKSNDIMPSPWGAFLDYSKDGTPYICQTDRIFKLGESIFDFVLNDYILSEIISFKVNDDGFDILVLLDNYYYRIVIKEGPSALDKKEIVLATGFIKKNLQNAAAAFNRTNDNYHVTIYQMEDFLDTTSAVYFGEIQKQLALGKGPDIVTDDVVTELADFVDSGYLAPLDLNYDKDSFIDGIFDSIIYNGIIYGIPYDFNVKTILAKSKLIDHAGPFSADEFMEKVSNSDAEILQSGKDSFDILFDYFLGDMSNNTYIDWEKGISHLNSEDFLRVLAFAEKYGDSSGVDSEPVSEYQADYINNGKSFCEQLEIDDVYYSLNRIIALFSGEYSYIGYPTSEGNGTLIETGSLYLSSFCKEKEGALEFLRFVISEENQRRVAEAPAIYDEGFNMGVPARHPVLKKEFEHELEFQRHRKDERYFNNPTTGLKYKTTDIPYKDLDLFKEAVYGASVRRSLPDDAEIIIWEELYPYFTDQCSMDEAVDKLHNRMQLYLDERGKRK